MALRRRFLGDGIVLMEQLAIVLGFVAEPRTKARSGRPLLVDTFDTETLLLYFTLLQYVRHQLSSLGTAKAVATILENSVAEQLLIGADGWCPADSLTSRCSTTLVPSLTVIPFGDDMLP